MMILSLLWLTTASPLESPKGRVPSWKVVENVPDITKAEDRRRPRHHAEAEQGLADRRVQRARRGRRRARHQGVDAHRAGTRPTTTASPSSPTSPVHGPPDVGRSVGAIRSSGRASSTTRPKYAVVEFCKTADPDADVRAAPAAARVCERRRRAARVTWSSTFDYGTLRLPAVRRLRDHRRSSSASVCSRCTGGRRTRWSWRRPRPGPRRCPPGDDSELTKV